MLLRTLLRKIHFEIKLEESIKVMTVNNSIKRMKGFNFYYSYEITYVL